jgi:S-adenosyl methyltransferase
MTEYGGEESRDLLQAFNPTIPNVARIYDFLLGGKDNYAADREAAQRLLDAVPGAVRAARDNRRFLGRAVWFLAREAGIRQFLDIGTGLPTRGNVHEIAHAARPGARVVYADNDPVVVTHARALLADSLTVAAVQGDLRDPGRLCALPDVQAFIDWDEPVAVLMVAVLHFLEDRDDPWEAVDAFKARMAPGSYLVLSHVTGDDTPADVIRQASEVYEHASAPGMARSRAQIARFFDGLDMVSPGLADPAEWRRPRLEGDSRPVLFYAGVGRKHGGTGEAAI